MWKAIDDTSKERFLLLAEKLAQEHAGSEESKPKSKVKGTTSRKQSSKGGGRCWHKYTCFFPLLLLQFPGCLPRCITSSSRDVPVSASEGFKAWHSNSAASTCSTRPLQETEGGPKKPLSAYIIFCREERPRIIAENPELSFGEAIHPPFDSVGVLSEIQGLIVPAPVAASDSCSPALHHWL